MSRCGDEPPDIAVIFNKPGRTWSVAERDRLVGWLFEEPQLRCLLVIALRHLGPAATSEDAEDVLIELCIRRLNAVINSYDPSKGTRFWAYLVLCFTRFCHDEGPKILKRASHEGSLEITAATDAGEIIVKLADDPESSDPALVVERNELRRAVRQCIDRLPPPYRMVIVLYYFADMSVRQIATELNISMANVTIRLLRARLKLAECLRKEGWI